tara:strand:- start:2538 stop:2798 length:261 start_codon:yes stop_codon:yes gene_type:complete
MTKYIKLISAEKGKLLFTFNDKSERSASKVLDIANILSEYATKDFAFSSTMEFAKEEGFEKNDSAMALYNKAVRYNQNLDKLFGNL